MAHFVYPLICQSTLGLFVLLATVRNAVVNIGICVSIFFPVELQETLEFWLLVLCSLLTVLNIPDVQTGYSDSLEGTLVSPRISFTPARSITLHVMKSSPRGSLRPHCSFAAKLGLELGLCPPNP
jgi:hypothetical protein